MWHRKADHIPCGHGYSLKKNCPRPNLGCVAMVHL